jgi:glutathione peroxidase-family protein
MCQYSKDANNSYMTDRDDKWIFKIFMVDRGGKCTGQLHQKNIKAKNKIEKI